LARLHLGVRGVHAFDEDGQRAVSAVEPEAALVAEREDNLGTPLQSAQLTHL